MEHGRESDQESRANTKKCSKNSGNESKKMEEEESTSETEISCPEEGSEEEVQSQESGVAIHSNYHIVGGGGIRDEEEDAFVDEEESGEEEEKSAEEEQFDMEEDAFTDETQSSASEEEENEGGESQETGAATDSRYSTVGEEELSGEDNDDSADEDQSDSDMEEVVLAGPNPPPALHPDFKNWIQTLFNGQEISISDEILVIQKQLSETEANGDRFVIPLGIIWNELFTDNEIKILNLENFIRVTIIDPVVENVSVELKRYLMVSNDKAGGEPSRAYALKGDWNRFAAAKNLEEGDIVQVWAVRAGGNLCFLLVKLSRGAGDSSGCNASIPGGTDTHESEAQANTSSPSNHLKNRD